jgi:putative copper export protein/mono/diheme cytochrome c family protein
MDSLASTIAAVRGLHLAATLSLLGTAGFLAWMLPAASAVPEPLRRRLTNLWWGSGLIALLAGMAWFTLQAAAIADASTLPDVLDALPVVALHTRYGNILLVRLGLLAVAAALAWLGRARLVLYSAIAFTVIALGLEGLIGHAGATAGAIGDGLVLSEALHLSAAGIWLGALLPLWFGLRALAPAPMAAVCERFTPIGLGCVLVLAGTGFAQGFELIGGLPALFGTRYGHIAVLKIALFLLALALAAVNRLWLTDRLAAGATGARRHLLLSVSLETCAGLAIVTAAAFMASSPPAAHTTPVWPLSWQLSLVAVNEDPEFLRSVVISLVMIGVAIALMVAALLWRRLRWEALAILVLTLLFSAPSLGLLLVEAYPTSFQTSPTDFSAASIAQGQTLFAANCTGCHGPEGDGNGPAAAGLRIKPADLTMPHLWEHSDGEMFWWLTHGIEDPEGGLAMPGFGDALPEDGRWALIDYVRAHNAGVAMQQEAAFDVPVRTPAFPVTCVGLAASGMADLRGQAVHVVTDDAAKDAIPPQAGIKTVTVDLRDGAKPAAGSCVAAASSAWQAYAVLAGVAPDKLAGAEFLIDPNGWLRAVHRQGEAGGWHTRDDLIAAIRGICSSPIQAPSGDQHEHHH